MKVCWLSAGVSSFIAGYLVRDRDAENGMCSLRSDLSYPLLEYCVEGPCPDEVLICNNCPLDGHCEFVKCKEKEI